MFSPSGSAQIATTSAPASRSARGPASQAAPWAQSRTTLMPSRGWLIVETRCAAYCSTAVAVRGDPADVTAGRTVPRLAHPLLDRHLDGVVELDATSGQELDAVVGHRVVRGREHHAEVGAELGGQPGDPRRRQLAEQQHVDAGGGQPGDHGRLEELPGDAGVAADDRERPVPGEGAALGEHVGSGDRQVQGQLRGQRLVGEPPDPVGTEETRHPTQDQRLLNCGALRAFLSPAFLRSMTRASRVSSPAFFRPGRLASSSMKFRHRATPRRSAPA